MIRLLSFIIIILILGTAFKEQFNLSSLDKVRVAYYNEDSGEFGELFISSMIHTEELIALADFEAIASLEEGRELINSGTLDAVVYIPSEFSEQGEGEPASKTIEVYVAKTSGIDMIVVQNMMDSLVNGMNTTAVIASMAVDMTHSEPNSLSTISLQDEPLTNSKAATAMGYYAIAMLLMFLLSGQEYGTASMKEDYMGALGDRIALSPMKPYEQYLGKILGLSFVTFIQGMIIILFTKYVYDVDWGAHFGVIVLIVFVFSLLTTTLGGMLMIITKDVVKANSIASIITLVGTFLVGGFVIIDFGMLAAIAPSYYAKAALFNVIYHHELSAAYMNIGQMLAITMLFVVISIVASRRARA